MPADFPASIAFLLHLEGGYSNIKNDKGGKTKYGISAKEYPKFLKLYGNKLSLPQDNTNISIDQAIEIYREEFWTQIKGDKIKNKEICMRLLALNVNAGITATGKIVQNALIDSGKTLSDIGGSIDGILGSKSINALNSVNPEVFLDNLYKRSKIFYTGQTNEHGKLNRIDPNHERGNLRPYLTIKTLSEAKKINQL